MACLGRNISLANQVSGGRLVRSFSVQNTFGITLVPICSRGDLFLEREACLVGFLHGAAVTLFILAGVIANISILFSTHQPFQHAGDVWPPTAPPFSVT